MRIVFAKEAREGQNAEDKAERLMAATGHHLEDVIALLRQRNTSTLCWPLKACESLNTRDRAEHLTAETGMMATCHLLGIAKQVSGNPSDTQSAFRQLWEKYGVKRRRHDLSSVFMTVVDPDTPWHPQFFRAVTLESQRIRIVHQHIVAESRHHLVCRHLFADTRATHHPADVADRPPSAEKHVRMVLAMEARECLNIQVQAERLMTMSGCVFEDHLACT